MLSRYHSKVASLSDNPADHIKSSGTGMSVSCVKGGEGRNTANLHNKSTSLGPTLLVSYTKKGKEKNKTTLNESRSPGPRHQGRQIYEEMRGKERDEPKRRSTSAPTNDP